MIKVENLSKKYTITHEDAGSYKTLREVLAGKAKRRPDQAALISKEDHWALKDVSFEIKKGEAVGIIGRNGAGKSTLLKILSRITEPTTGRVELNGRVASLLEVGTGFHPELSGRENVFLNGAILGMSRAEIKGRFDEIVDFSGVEKFLDTPVKRYSSGMYVRLAFAIAAHLEPEILVVDEVLAVGDADFQKKCLGKMNEVSRQDGRTVLFVSHQLGMIAQLCKQSILLEAGHIVLHAETGKVINTYLQGATFSNSYIADPLQVQDKSAYIATQRLVNIQGETISQMTNADPIILEVGIVIREWNSSLELSVSLQHKIKGRVFTINKLISDYMRPNESNKTFRIIIPPNTIAPNHYSWLNSLHLPGVGLADVLWDECNFTIADAGTEFARYEGTDYGVVMLNNYTIEAS